MDEEPEHRHRRRVSELLLAKVSDHGALLPSDQSAIRNIDGWTKLIAAGEDIVCQGERPNVAVCVLRGMLGRYQTLPSGERQFLSFHIAGDMPDIQSLFLAVMDHSLCTLDEALIALFPHDQLINLVLKYPGVGFAFWRITLVDAAIFRQAITNNSTRKPVMRIAHFFCEQYYRAREAGLVKAGACSLPLSQEKLGQTLGMSLVSVNRTLQDLRRHGLLDFRAGTLQIAKWRELTRVAGFDPAYLHVAKDSDVSRMTFRRRRR